MDLNQIGRAILIMGVVLLVTGGLLMLVARIPALRHLGNLPGDIRIQGEGFSCFFPLATMFILSILLTIVLNVIIRLINRP